MSEKQNHTQNPTETTEHMPQAIGDILSGLLETMKVRGQTHFQGQSDEQRRRLAAREQAHENLLRGAADEHRDLLARNAGEEGIDPEVVEQSRKGVWGDESDAIQSQEARRSHNEEHP